MDGREGRECGLMSLVNNSTDDYSLQTLVKMLILCRQTLVTNV